jgi:hypothetical protein
MPKDGDLKDISKPSVKLVGLDRIKPLERIKPYLAKDDKSQAVKVFFSELEYVFNLSGVSDDDDATRFNTAMLLMGENSRHALGVIDPEKHTTFVELKKWMLEVFAGQLVANFANFNFVNLEMKPGEKTLEFVQELWRLARETSLDVKVQETLVPVLLVTKH